MKLQEAYYGDKDGAHQLLSFSGSDSTPFWQAYIYTDRGTAGGPVINSPSLAAASIGSYYAICKLLADNTASRPGMTFSHVLLLPLAELRRIQNLSPILALLPSAPNRGLVATVRELSDDDLVKASPRAMSVDHDALSLADALLSGTRYPVVWIDSPDHTLETFLPTLWALLPLDLRATFSFRLALSPQEENIGDLPLVTTLPELSSRWEGFSVLKGGAFKATPTETARLLGNTMDAAAFRTFAENLAVRIDRFATFRLVQKAYGYYKDGVDSAVAARSYVQLLNVLSPDPRAAESVRASALADLARLTEAGSFSDILGLRSVEGPTDVTILNASIRQWIFKSGFAMNSANITALCDALADKESPTWWRAIVEESFSEAFESWPADRSANIIWTLLRVTPSVAILKRRALSAAIEDALIALTTASDDLLDSEAIRSTCLYHNWPALYATALLRNETSTALEAFVDFDPSSTSLRGYNLIATRTGTGHFVELALQRPGSPFEQVTAHLLRSDPFAFAEADAASAQWRSLWLRTIEAGAPPLAGVVDATIPLTALWNSRASSTGDVSYIPLLEHLIIAAPKAALQLTQTFPLWDAAGTRREAVMEALADSWLTTFSAASPPPPAPLRALMINSNRVRSFLQHEAIDDIPRGIALFDSLIELTEEQFDWYLRESIRVKGPKGADAEKIADLIERKGWHALSRRLADTAIEQPVVLDMMIQGASIFWGMLGGMQRMWLAATPQWTGPTSSVSDWWEALESVAVTLYNFGPTDRRLWERALGDNAALSVGVTGREQWRAALSLLRAGGGGKITVKSLLRVMMDEHKSNSQLAALYKARPTSHGS